MPTVQVGRVYDPPEESTGLRVLVDRLWPRGMTKERAALDEWLRDVSPSTELRRWYAHEPSRWTEFGARYRQELSEGPQAEALARLRTLAADPAGLTLLTAAKAAAISEATVLAELLNAD